MKSDINKGIWINNGSPCGKEATIVATGLGRSGTTMLARILSELGIFLGDRITPQSHEDKDIQIMVKNKKYDEFSDLCKQRNLKMNKWGFKCPAIRSDLIKFSEHMKNPRLIVVFRDLLSISLRNNIALEADVIETMLRSANGYTTMINQLEGIRCPVLAISYEKALQFPEETVESIARFCGISPVPHLIERGIAVIKNGDEKYLKGK